MSPEGTPVFTQVLRWKGDPNVLFYEVTLQTADGQEISQTKTTEPKLTLSLAPGDYRYQVVFYNLLRKPEVELAWQQFTILEAEIPRVDSSGPKVWYLEDFTPALTIRGEMLVSGATVELTPEGGSGAPIAGTEQGHAGISELSVSFSGHAFAEGAYNLEVTNPGGLSTTLPHALLVRHMLPEPAGLVPVPGATFGPSELRAKRSIDFSWSAVPEATRYAFCLYKGSNTEPMIRQELQECAFALDDLSVLDRGDFRWTVEAQGTDAAGDPIPAAGAARASFRIDLPQLPAPDLNVGDTFYGR